MPKKIKLKDRVDNSPPVYIPLSSNQTRFSEGDVVDTPDGLGIVVEVRTETFEGPSGSEVEASEDSPTYVVGLEDEDTGVGVFSASDLTTSELPETDVDNPISGLEESETANVAQNLSANESLTANDFNVPESWEESETPARLIALDAWSSMGGQFDCGGSCCKGTMAPSLGDRGSDEFCASFKDFILGGWEGWR